MSNSKYQSEGMKGRRDEGKKNSLQHSTFYYSIFKYYGTRASRRNGTGFGTFSEFRKSSEKTIRQLSEAILRTPSSFQKDSEGLFQWGCIYN